jgi:hypothetical protein
VIVATAGHDTTSSSLAGEPEYTATTVVGGPKRMPIRYRLRPAAA